MTPKQLRHNVRELRIVADKPVTLLPAKLLVVVNVILLTATRRTVKKRALRSTGAIRRAKRSGKRTALR